MNFVMIIDDNKGSHLFHICSLMTWQGNPVKQGQTFESSTFMSWYHREGLTRTSLDSFRQQFERLLSSVNFEIIIQTVSMSEFLLTKVTLARFFFRVNSEMGIQIAFPIEFLFTKLTLEGLFSSVNFQMGFQIAFLSESLFAKVTLKRLFSSMNSEMVFQMASCCKSLVTTIALESFLFCNIF